MDGAYLTYRAPLPVNSSYYFGLAEPLCTVGTEECGATSPQAWQAARICLPLVEEALRIHEGQSPVDQIRRKPLCMAANRSLFGTSRLPTAQRDTVQAAYIATGAHQEARAAVSAGGQSLTAARTSAGEPLWIEDVTQWTAEAHQEELQGQFAVKCASSGRGLGARRLCPWVAVLRKGRTFRVSIGAYSSDGRLQLKSLEQLSLDFMQVIELCDAEVSAAEFSPAALTAGDRDTWTAQWQVLQTAGQNAEHMNTMVGALLVVCLDSTEVTSAAELSAAALHGTSQPHVQEPWQHNRWWDKTCQVVVAPPSAVSIDMEQHGHLTSHVGGVHCPTLLIWEHSMSDGHVSYCMLSRLIAAKQLPASSRKPSKGMVSASSDVAELKWSCAAPLRSRLHSATSRHFKQLLATQDIQTSIFGSYGANTIKKYGCSPDAWAQVAFQIAAMRTDAVLRSINDWTNLAAVQATYSFWDTPGADFMTCTLPLEGADLKPVPQYEPVQMRGFVRGRTECARGASIETVRAGRLLHAACEMTGVADPVTDIRAVWTALQTAIHGHSSVCRTAAAGSSFDRHLFGLRKTAAGDNIDKKVLPKTLEVLSSPALAAASDWRVSTSNLSGAWLKAWGWGQVTASGVGVAYSTLSAFGKDALMIHIAAMNTEDVHGVKCYRPRARVYLTETMRALRQMRHIAEQAAADTSCAKL